MDMTSQTHGSPSLLERSAPEVSPGLSQEDREQAVGYLAESRRGLERAAAALTDAQWRFRPAPDRWTIADIVEHLVISERAVRMLLARDLTKRPPLPLERRPRVRDLAILLAATNRDKKFEAAKLVKPLGDDTEPVERLKAFLGARADTIGYVMTTTDDLRSWAEEHPVIGVIDAYQWILFLAGHCDRHTQQLLEVKADSKFPRS